MSPSVNLPVTLTANTPENVADLNANLNAIVAALNGGLDEVNVPNLTAAFTTYKRIVRATSQLTSAHVANTYLLPVQSYQTGTSNAILAGAANASPADFLNYLDPAIYNANTRTTKLIVRAVAVVNATAPAVNFTVGLYPIATYGGAAGASPTIATLGAVVAGSTAAVNTPAATAMTTAIGTDFNFPAAGAYTLAVATSGTPAVNSVTHIVAQLEMRQV